mmetsp:Transcript_5231/g.8201  ORF Transcript_5231/g.8201 Transcript_5231/m.8201 type:complete len:128 (-) Transcript_5231:61-444(-)|eukprot:CAMPEP_0175104316 /NCGR_PEP_ID=MMETSP0086_2-20121207/9649_1 /TAXON_ID=136419 /ORGANISM="Unknown Unknown, Strain D1" /LENGTH=127 /DNA_ID=CAMNT_0016379673 /DNA_START=37 /DNA_END=420 /DNA_ORIENTATION=+
MSVTIRTRKFTTNRLLNRKQMILDVMHPGKAPVSKADLTTALASRFNINDEKTIFVFGFKTAMGGQKSTGFALIYDTAEDALSTEPKYRLIRKGIGSKATGSRKQRRELKNRVLKVRGIAKRKIGAK